MPLLDEDAARAALISRGFQPTGTALRAYIAGWEDGGRRGASDERQRLVAKVLTKKLVSPPREINFALHILKAPIPRPAAGHVCTARSRRGVTLDVVLRHDPVEDVLVFSHARQPHRQHEVPLAQMAALGTVFLTGVDESVERAELRKIMKAVRDDARGKTRTE